MGAQRPFHHGQIARTWEVTRTPRGRVQCPHMEGIPVGQVLPAPSAGCGFGPHPSGEEGAPG